MPVKPTKLLIVALVCVLAGCVDSGRQFSQYRHIDDGNWAYNDTLRFVPVHDDSVATGRLRVAVRHLPSFPYDRLVVELCSCRPAAGSRPGVDTIADVVWQRDTVQFILADKQGRWLGKGRGISYQMQVELPDYVHVSGEPILVRNLMRQEVVDGVTDVGVFFEY